MSATGFKQTGKTISTEQHNKNVPLDGQTGWEKFVLAAGQLAQCWDFKLKPCDHKIELFITAHSVKGA